MNFWDIWTLGHVDFDFSLFDLLFSYEMINVNLISKPKWFTEMNPSGKVPTIMINNQVYYESLPVCDLLDEIYEGPKLNPDSVEQRTKDKMALANFDNVSSVSEFL